MAEYGYCYPFSYDYGSGLASATLAATPLPTSGNYCATPVKTCQLYEPGVFGTGCSCKVPVGRAR